MYSRYEVYPSWFDEYEPCPKENCEYGNGKCVDAGYCIEKRKGEHMEEIKQQILKEAKKLINNINEIYENLEPRNYLDDEGDMIAMTYYDFYDEVTEAVHGFKTFYNELIKRFNGDKNAKTWFLRVENAVCWIKYSHDDLGYFNFDKNVSEMYNAYWSIVEKMHIYEENEE